MDETSNNAEIPVAIPEKLYFKIGEVCKLTGVKQHVLRFWESEFKIIRPQRGSSKQRLYRRTDIEKILEIKELLYKEGFTIAGARKRMAGRQQTAPRQKACGRELPKADNLYQTIISELRDIKKILEQ